jgi:Ca-activated chloride channel family protein
MKNSIVRMSIGLCLILVFCLTSTLPFSAQSRPQRPENRPGDGKRNQRPTPKSEEELRREEEERRRLEEEKNAVVTDEVVRIETNVVSLDAIVINRKSKQIVQGLKREQFQIFEDGVKQEISSFTNPEAPITVTLVLEYSKWTETLGRAGSGRFEPGVYETVRPVAQFLSRFIKPPDDYASVIAFDMRPTPITDFTNDPRRINETINLLLRNQPAFRENNLFDSIKFALVGGRGDSVVLEDSPNRYSEYGGMVSVQSKRRAIILVASGIDTFSRISYDEVRKVIQEAGIPIYIISTGNLFYKRYEHLLGPTDDITGGPGRLTFLQAKNAMDTFAKESGGVHYEMTFPTEIPDYLQNINALLRNQYSMAYELEKKHQPGKKYKLEVKVDVDGDGTTDEKQFVVQHRPYVYTQTEKERDADVKKK